MDITLITSIKDFFNNSGWLANALGIGLPAFGGMVLIKKRFLTKSGNDNIDSITPKNLNSIWTHEKSKSIASIAIVDDQLQDFPVEDLKKNKYLIETFEQVNLADNDRLSMFDIVFLDMKGIVKDDLDEGGLKLIATLRRLNPNQKICAVSGQRFDPTATEFFKLADDNKKKPLTAQECKLVIDNFLSEIFNPTDVIEKVRELLKNLPIQSRVSIIRDIEEYSIKKQTIENLTLNLGKLGINKENQTPIITLARMIANAA